MKDRGIGVQGDSRTGGATTGVARRQGCKDKVARVESKRALLHLIHCVIGWLLQVMLVVPCQPCSNAVLCCAGLCWSCKKARLL